MGKINGSSWAQVVIVTFLLLIGGVFCPLFAASYQQVELVPSGAGHALNSNFTVSARYNVSDGVKQLTGIGFRIYFDSTKIDFTGSTNLFSTSQTGADTTPQIDTANVDGDASTDKYLGFAWVDLSGAWPGTSQTLPLELVRIGFTVKNTAAVAVTPLNLIFTSTTAGYQGQATNASVNITGNVSVSSSSGVVLSDMTVTNSIPAPPANYTPETVVSFKATGVVSTANISITYSSLPANRVFYKVVNGQWKQIYPSNQSNGITNITLIGNTLSFTIADNSDCDGDPAVGVISDPLVVGSETSSGGGGGGCFIATAAWGSYLDPHVQVLRAFRDHYLITNSPGKAFVDYYYSISPPVAGYIKQHESLRTFTRFILTPVVYGLECPWLVLIFGGVVIGMWGRKKTQIFNIFQSSKGLDSSPSKTSALPAINLPKFLAMYFRKGHEQVTRDSPGMAN